MHEHILQRSQRVPVPAERAFDLYADAVNLEPMTPPWLHFRVTTPGPIAMGAGTLLDYRLRLHGFPIRWQTRIENAIPYGPLGGLAHSLFVRRDLERIFDFRRDAFTAHFAAE